jgi:hypothetical protein
MSWQFESIRLAPPAGPDDAGTVTLFDSTTMFPGGLRQWGIGRIKLSFPGLSQPSGTNGLVGYTSGDKGVTWKQTTLTSVGTATSIPCTVAADTGTNNSQYDIYVGPFDDVKITFTASATKPTAASWAMVVISVDQGNVHSGS